MILRRLTQNLRTHEVDEHDRQLGIARDSNLPVSCFKTLRNYADVLTKRMD